MFQTVRGLRKTLKNHSMAKAKAIMMLSTTKIGKIEGAKIRESPSKMRKMPKNKLFPPTTFRARMMPSMILSSLSWRFVIWSIAYILSYAR